METERKDLLRCIWCNFKMVVSTSNGGNHHAYCDNCGAEGPHERSEDRAVLEYNRVAAPYRRIENFTSHNNARDEICPEYDMWTFINQHGVIQHQYHICLCKGKRSPVA